DGIDGTLMILQHRLKADGCRPAIEIIKDYGKFPLIECYPGQLNQVFMNILANAIDALEEGMGDTSLPEAALSNHEKISPPTPQITIRTEVLDNQFVVIRIADNGSG
ncbi:MAG: ATPase, partial [Nostoc sp.]